MMNCSGIDASSGAGIEISCEGDTIAAVRAATGQEHEAARRGAGRFGPAAQEAGHDIYDHPLGAGTRTLGR